MNNTELLEKYRHGDTSVEDDIIKNNMGLVYSVVSRFSNRSCETEDLIQIGAIGLLKAVRKFDFSYGVQLSTYAVPMIAGEIKRFLRDDGAIKVSRSIKENAVKGRRAEEKLRKQLGRDPGINEISKEAGISTDELLQAFDAMIAPESLNAGVGEKNDENSMKKIELQMSDDTEEKIVDKVFLRDSLSGLSSRERSILIMRYFRGKTQNEIAAMIGVSQVQVSRLEKKALKKIREGMF